MCGIMGYVGNRPVVDVLLQGLKRLEYRGYDSAGIAFLDGNEISIRKSEGKIRNVEKLLRESGAAQSHCGIGHTRWATHGKPTTQNAHPHRTGHVVLVHNGIIENYQEIKEQLLERGHQPASETDSELFGFLVYDEMESGAGLVEAVRKSFLQLEGSCSVVVFSEREPDKIVGVRNGSPLVAGIDDKGGTFLASDAQPLLDYTQKVIFLDHGDVVVANKDTLEFYSLNDGSSIQRESTLIDWSADKLDKQGYPHYMLKEIFEQPLTLVDTVNGVLDRVRTDPFPLAEQPAVDILKKASEIVLIACGTAWHAGLVGKYWIERWAGVKVNLEYASEFRYRDPVIDREAVVVGISQSGETADTLAVIREMRRRGLTTLALTNTRGSTLARECHGVFYTSAGPEIGVAATKTFSAQMVMLLIWAGYLGLQRGRDTAIKIAPLFDEMIRLPHFIESLLQKDSPLVLEAKHAAKKLSDAGAYFFIGRGYNYPMALEGALKLKEIAYVHAEGYAGGELKHGPIAMIDENMVVVVLAPPDVWQEKTLSNLQEVKARGARILGVGFSDDQKLRGHCDEYISIGRSKEFDESLFPFLVAPAIHLLSYEIANLKGTDIDQPRNLAKSVTVE